MVAARPNLRLILQAPMLAVIFPAVGCADEMGTPARQGGLVAKLEYCKTCHGLSGQGYLGYFPMPRLAGQQPEYIEAQLRAPPLPLKGCTTAWAGPPAAAWTGLSHIIGPPTSNTITINLGMAAF